MVLKYPSSKLYDLSYHIGRQLVHVLRRSPHYCAAAPSLALHLNGNFIRVNKYSRDLCVQS